MLNSLATSWLPIPGATPTFQKQASFARTPRRKPFSYEKSMPNRAQICQCKPEADMQLPKNNAT